MYKMRFFLVMLLLTSGIALRVVVFGASGRTGRLLIEKCINDARIDHIVCAVRDQGKARKLFGKDTSRLSIVPCDIVVDSRTKLSGVVRGADAVICAAGHTTFSSPNPFDAQNVDGKGTRKLIDAAADACVPRFVLLSSLLTNGLVAGQLLNPGYIFLNAVGGVLVIKRLTEMYLERQSELAFCVVRPGGLSDGEPKDPILFGSQDTLFEGSIPRVQVAEVLLEAALTPEARNKIVEIVASPDAAPVPWDVAFRGLA